jgi:hypothetical protein
VRLAIEYAGRLLSPKIARSMKNQPFIPCGQIFSVLYAPAPGVISDLRGFALKSLLEINSFIHLALHFTKLSIFPEKLTRKYTAHDSRTIKINFVHFQTQKNGSEDNYLRLFFCCLECQI